MGMGGRGVSQGGGKAGVIPNRGCPRCHLHPQLHALSARPLLLSNPNTRLSPYLIACTSRPLLCTLTFFRIPVHDCMLACDHRQRRGNDDAIAPCLMRKMRERCWRRRAVVGTSSLYALSLFCSVVFCFCFPFPFIFFCLMKSIYSSVEIKGNRKHGREGSGG